MNSRSIPLTLQLIVLCSGMTGSAGAQGLIVEKAIDDGTAGSDDA